MHDESNNNEVTEIVQKRFLLGIGLALVLASAAFFSGLQVGNTVQAESQSAGLFSLFAGEPQPADEADLEEFWRVWHLLDEKFAAASSTEIITIEEKLQGAISGMVRSYGDPYTSYLPPSDAEMFDEDISGNFSGVGMEVGMRNDVITIISPLPGTPAEQVGLQPGDVIVEIDRESTENMNIDRAVRNIRGPEGSDVTLTIFREGAREMEDFVVTRAQIEIPTVETSQQEGVFIIALYSFNALSEMKMQEALREYVQSGSDKLIIDLRGNPGGFLQSAVAIASYFLPTGKVVLRESFGEGQEEQLYRSQGKTLKQFAPDEIVVLIDGGSASASEILAGALHEQDYATLVGTNSFGKGSVQELVNLPQGSALKVTIARWLTPNGTTLSAGGLTPDVIVERTVEQRLADEDPQLETALDVILNRYVPPASQAGE